MTANTQANVRTATTADRDHVLRVAVDSGLFTHEDVASFAAVVRSGLGGRASESVWLVAVAEDGPVVGAAYAGPEPFGDRVWNLYFLAVDRSHQSRGVGTALVGELLARLRSAGEDVARVLLVETSSGPEQAPAREFYDAQGFEEQARIREYYGPDQDKVVFWRRLSDA